MRGSPIVENTISLLTPFFAYLPAEWLGLSGVLSVVAVGLYFSRLGPRIVPAATRVQAESMWVMVQFILESLVFILVGLELPSVLRTLRHLPAGHAPALWRADHGDRDRRADRLHPLAASLIRWSRRGTRDAGTPSWRQAAFLGWAGMRGGDSLVIALAVPVMTAAGDPFPARGLIIFLTFVGDPGDAGAAGSHPGAADPLVGPDRGRRSGTEEAHARRVVAEAGLRRLEEEATHDGVDRTTARYLEATYRRRVQRWAARDRERHGQEDEDHAGLAGIDGSRAELVATAYRALRAAMIEDEREALVRLRDQGVIGDHVLRRVQRDLDLETMLLESAEDGAPQSPYEVE